jgi:alginate O-acetyltransferase complex protein AlgI
VFFLCGLWHGASWNFVIWGLWHGTFLVIERVYSQSRNQSRNQLPDYPITRLPDTRVLSWPVWPHVYTMLVVMIGWVFFRAETPSGAIAFLKAMAGATIAEPTPYTVRWYLTPELWLALLTGAIGSTPWVPAVASRIARAEGPGAAWRLDLLGTAALMALLVASIMSVAARTYNPFIYFRF